MEIYYRSGRTAFFLLFWSLPRNLQVMRETFILIKNRPAYWLEKIIWSFLIKVSVVCCLIFQARCQMFFTDVDVEVITKPIPRMSKWDCNNISFQYYISFFFPAMNKVTGPLWFNIITQTITLKFVRQFYVWSIALYIYMGGFSTKCKNTFTKFYIFKHLHLI